MARAIQRKTKGRWFAGGLAFTFFLISILWGKWARVLDFVDHLSKTIPGLDSTIEKLRSVAATWLEAHARLANQVGPWIFFSAGILALLSPTLVPVVHRAWERLRVAREADAASGWSVSIRVPNTISGTFSSPAVSGSMLAFQQFRFVNVSNVQPRVIDVEITLPSAENGRPMFVWRSTDQGKSKYQQQIEALPGNVSAHHRWLHFIDFPLRLGPSEMIDGQIVIGLPDEVAAGRPLLLNEWLDHRKMTFKFTEHMSGRDVLLKIGEDLDAHSGKIAKRGALTLRQRWLRLKVQARTLREKWSAPKSAHG